MTTFASRPHTPADLPSAEYFAPSPRLCAASPLPRRLTLTADAPRPGSPAHPFARSPYLASRPLSIASGFGGPSARGRDSVRPHSWASSALMDDVLAPGDLVGQGLDFAGAPLRAMPGGDALCDLAPELEVVRKLGTGSYAVVYLVREVLSRPAPPSSDDHATGDLDEAVHRVPGEIEYGREFALKCLSKLNLVDEEALAAQMTEVHIHQSLPTHSNIVTLHKTFETPAYLLLLLEYVPGEDLFYFLEQARDHYDGDATEDALQLIRTPPTPSLLSSLAPHQLLSRTRLRLIASMFGQMCGAVQACHDRGVFHRDIKPENFIVTDGFAPAPDGGARERKVVVKLSDFGLSTTDVDSADMDCGSAPYMSYECRNNLAPTYQPRAADVWSLGIVLINMLYHFNPWTDAADGACGSFALFREQPVSFFLHRFAGMTPAVADFLAHRVFSDADVRASAGEFGAWARALPDLLGPPAVTHGSHRRVLSTSSTHAHALGAAGPSSRPVSRAGSGVPAARTPARRTRTLSRGASDARLAEAPALAEPELSTILDESPELEEAAEHEAEAELEADGGESRSQSTTKRRKRGARKGKAAAAAAAAPAVDLGALDDKLNTLASASQLLARELSRQTRLPHTPPSPVAAPAQAAPTMLKKASKWKLSFGKSAAPPPVPPVEDTPPPARVATATASNVSSLIMGLSAAGTGKPPSPVSMFGPAPDEAAPRRAPPPPLLPPPKPAARGRPAPVPAAFQGFQGVLPPLPQQARRGASPGSARRGASPTSVRSGASTQNWRSGMSSAATSTSAFTRFSNGSVSTVATSVSADSWRASKPSSLAPRSARAQSPLADHLKPVNVKLLNGIPWELHELPRGQHPQLEGDIFCAPPQPRAPRTRRSKQPLGAIAEAAAPAQRADAATSTTDLSAAAPDDEREGGPKKVQKGQINALAKMLSALRR